MAWLPAVKIVLPYLAQIASAAIPALTRKADRSESDEVTRRQIAELQDAVTRNAESIRTLAAQMEKVVQDLDAASVRVQHAMQTARQLAVAALAVAVVAAGLALYAVLR